MVKAPANRTPRQQEVLDAITVFIRVNGYSPSIREIGDVTDMWPSSVAKALNALRDQGAVEWVEGQARTIRIIGK